MSKCDNDVNCKSVYFERGQALCCLKKVSRSTGNPFTPQHANCAMYEKVPCDPQADCATYIKNYKADGKTKFKNSAGHGKVCIDNFLGGSGSEQKFKVLILL